MFGEVGLDGKLNPAQIAGKLPLPVVVNGLFVVFHGRPVAEVRGAEGARDGLTCMRGPNVSVQTRPAGEFAVTLSTSEM